MSSNSSLEEILNLKAPIPWCYIEKRRESVNEILKNDDLKYYWRFSTVFIPYCNDTYWLVDSAHRTLNIHKLRVTRQSGLFISQTLINETYCPHILFRIIQFFNSVCNIYLFNVLLILILNFCMFMLTYIYTHENSICFFWISIRILVAHWKS